METQLTFDELGQLDRELANADFMAEQDTQLGALDLKGKLQKICSIYKNIKPVLGIILSIPFIPENVKKAVRTFMSVLDTVCI